jgi:hypothetical protein
MARIVLNPWISTVVSIVALMVSLVSLYYTNFYISEGLCATIAGYDWKIEEIPEGSKNYTVTGLIANVALVNSGNRNIVTSEIQFEFIEGEIGGMLASALKEKSDEFAYPILVNPRELDYLRIRFRFDKLPKGKRAPMPINLVFQTIGISGKIQRTKMKAGYLVYMNGEPHGYDMTGVEITQIRK